MAYTIVNPPKSFVMFGLTDPNDSPCYPKIRGCLPVYEEADVAFQFFVQTTDSSEADALCLIGSSGIQIGLAECDCEDFVVEWTESPMRLRLATNLVSYSWPHGLSGMTGNFSEGDYFKIMVQVGGETFCSNCFVRISQAQACDTSVVEYGNNENAFGFAYCSSNDNLIGGDSGCPVPPIGDCTPEVITFTNQTFLTIPYTTMLSDRFGDIPTVQIWIYDTGGQLVNMGIQAKFDAMPVSQILIDLGGLASGVVVIR